MLMDKHGKEVRKSPTRRISSRGHRALASTSRARYSAQSGRRSKSLWRKSKLHSHLRTGGYQIAPCLQEQLDQAQMQIRTQQAALRAAQAISPAPPAAPRVREPAEHMRQILPMTPVVSSIPLRSTRTDWLTHLDNGGAVHPDERPIEQAAEQPTEQPRAPRTRDRDHARLMKAVAERYEGMYCDRTGTRPRRGRPHLRCQLW